MTDEKKEPRGWGWPALANKAHYFIDARSLCGKWMYTGKLENNDTNSPDDCKTCVKKLSMLKK